ncbi:MAG: hypothetical protein FWH16_04965 [Oscillospiraceae bacterium]|nr:hypothetical protein [Oscillospiraceae bacterium]
MSPKTSKKVNSLIIAGTVVIFTFSVFFMGYVLDMAYGGAVYLELTGGRQGFPGSTNQINAGKVTDSQAGRPATPIPPPTPTPEGALPHITGFNPQTQLERITVWRDGKRDDGVSSTDYYLRVTYVGMCILLDEIKNYTPTGPGLKFINTYGGGQEQEFAVYEDDIAEFAGYEGRYFRIPLISVLADALLPAEEAGEGTRARMSGSGMIGCYGAGFNKVFLDKGVSKALTDAFYDMTKEGAARPAALPERIAALVFYYHGTKHYIDVYEGELMRFSAQGADVWYTVSTDELEAFVELLR